MSATHDRYIHLFKVYADSLLETSQRDLCTSKVKALSNKSSELLLKALFVSNIDILMLQKELFQLQKKYVQLYRDQ